MKISEMARETGINRGTLTRLYHETAERVDLDVLAALCSYLNCTISELLEYMPDQKAGPDRKP